MTRYPLTLTWPPGSSAGLPHGQWRHVGGRCIEVTYRTPDELALSLATANVNGSVPRTEAGRRALLENWHRELAAAGDREQLALIAA